MIPQLQQEAPASPSQGVPQWSLATRIGFRFVFSYCVLYLAPGPVGALGIQNRDMKTPLTDIWRALWHAVVPWVGAHVLHLRADFAEVVNGSGDEPYDCLLILCLARFGLIPASAHEERETDPRSQPGGAASAAPFRRPQGSFQTSRC